MLCLLYHEVEKNRITEELLLCMQHEEGAQEKIEENITHQVIVQRRGKD